MQLFSRSAGNRSTSYDLLGDFVYDNDTFINSCRCETLYCIYRKWWFMKIIAIIINDITQWNTGNLICEVFSKKRTTKCIQ